MSAGLNFGQRRHRTNWLASVAVIGLLLPAVAMAQAPEKRRFAIPAEDASLAIAELAKQSGLQVFAPADDLRGVRTNAVQGELMPIDAVRQLVARTGLEIIQTGTGAVTIRKPLPPRPAAAIAPATPATRTVTAQDGSALEEIVVTGSRIKRAGFDTLPAALVTDARDIERRGYTNVLDALQDTPGFGVPGSSTLGASQGRLAIGQSYANFFGLGSQRTLTLVNGRRFVSSNSPNVAGSGVAPGSQVDLNLIPAGLVERVETVAIGGAPVYGSDAIAGTVNIILKDHFEGVQGSVQYGLTEKGDARSKSGRILVGTDFADRRGNVVFSAEQHEQDGLRFSNRYGLLQSVANPADTSRTDGIPANIFSPDTRFAFMTEGGLPYRADVADIAGLRYPGIFPNGNYIFNSAGTPMRFATDGTLVPFNIGKVVQVAGGALAIPVLASGGDGVNAGDHFSLLTPSKRTLANVNAHYDLTDNVRFIAEASYARTTATLLSDLTSMVAPNLLNVSPSLTFSVNNPFLNAQARSILVANGVTNFNLTRNLSDIVDRTPATLREEVYRGVGGLEGKFQAFGQDWSWNASYNYGRSRSFSHDTYVNGDRLLLATNAVRNAAGNIVCASGGNCVPLNLFGENAFSPEAAAYVTDHTSGRTSNTQSVINGNLAGNLPFGIAAPIAINVGVEHRRETGSFSPNYWAVIGDALNGVPGYTAVSGRFHTNEIYGETVIPLIAPDQNFSAIKAASLEGSLRYVDHSQTGSATTWSTGGRITPRLEGWGEGLTLRGVFTHAIRSPSITELFLPSSGVLNGITDPCDRGQYNLGDNPAARTANCTAALAAVGAGSPANFRSTTRGISQAGFQSGNPNLRNEVANSWSAGFVYQSKALPRFNLAVDWSEIELKHGIELLDIGSVLASCYDSTNYPANIGCSQFRRLTAAQVAGTARAVGDIGSGYTTGYFNTSQLNFSGLIAVADYSFDVRDLVSDWGDAGSVQLSAKLVYTRKFDVISFAGGEVDKGAGLAAHPKFKVQGNIAYAWQKFDTSVQVVWTDKVVSDLNATNEDFANYTIPAYTMVNANVGYQVTPNLRAQLVVNNVFDKKLPEVALAGRAFSVYDALGRRYLFKLSASF